MDELGELFTVENLRSFLGILILKRSPTPKVGDLRPKVVGSVVVKSVGVVGLLFGKRVSLLKEKRCCAELKLITSWWME